MINSSKR
jgi:ATP-binding cassette subfamily B (MDR/TAP) protein 1